jgi:hypothetical protein
VKDELIEVASLSLGVFPGLKEIPNASLTLLNGAVVFLNKLSNRDTLI